MKGSTIAIVALAVGVAWLLLRKHKCATCGSTDTTTTDKADFKKPSVPVTVHQIAQDAVLSGAIVVQDTIKMGDQAQVKYPNSPTLAFAGAKWG